MAGGDGGRGRGHRRRDCLRRVRCRRRAAPPSRPRQPPSAASSSASATASTPSITVPLQRSAALFLTNSRPGPVSFVAGDRAPGPGMDLNRVGLMLGSAFSRVVRAPMHARCVYSSGLEHLDGTSSRRDGWRCTKAYRIPQAGTRSHSSRDSRCTSSRLPNVRGCDGATPRPSAIHIPPSTTAIQPRPNRRRLHIAAAEPTGSLACLAWFGPVQLAGPRFSPARFSSVQLTSTRSPDPDPLAAPPEALRNGPALMHVGGFAGDRPAPRTGLIGLAGTGPILRDKRALLAPYFALHSRIASRESATSHAPFSPTPRDAPPVCDDYANHDAGPNAKRPDTRYYSTDASGDPSRRPLPLMRMPTTCPRKRTRLAPPSEP
ncbi:hypothetical protein CDD83_1639 [Cordyceps sp. RAO-2017]|nr:hypothetical protein CDD83_1639 [Cordyceps sp. RAO-2017]